MHVYEAMETGELSLATRLNDGDDGPRVSYPGWQVDFSPDADGVARATNGQWFKTSLFPLLWSFIALVSVFDTYLTVRFCEHLEFTEENPIARLLLRIAGWEPSLLVSVKFLGTIVVLQLLTALHVQNRRIGLIVTGAIASLQLALLGYLVLA